MIEANGHTRVVATKTAPVAFLFFSQPGPRSSESSCYLAT
jgi:hypothetical protein